jgi:hypothetical protein
MRRSNSITYLVSSASDQCGVGRQRSWGRLFIMRVHVRACVSPLALALSLYQNVGLCSLGSRGVGLLIDGLASGGSADRMTCIDLRANIKPGEENHAVSGTGHRGECTNCTRASTHRLTIDDACSSACPSRRFSCVCCLCETSSLLHWFSRVRRSSLRSLSLSSNSWPDVAFGHLLPSMVRLTDLRLLDCSGIDMTMTELPAALCQAIRDTHTTTLQVRRAGERRDTPTDRHPRVCMDANDDPVACAVR